MRPVPRDNTSSNAAAEFVFVQDTWRIPVT